MGSAWRLACGSMACRPRAANVRVVRNFVRLGRLYQVARSTPGARSPRTHLWDRAVQR